VRVRLNTQARNSGGCMQREGVYINTRIGKEVQLLYLLLNHVACILAGITTVRRGVCLKSIIRNFYPDPEP
jgi:hypothetical protein